MAKSQLIKDIACGKISVSDAFYRLLVIANDIGNDTLIQWVKNEIDGYPPSKDVPDYRIRSFFNLQYSGYIGLHSVEHCPLNPQFLGEKNLEKIRNTCFKEGVAVLEKKSQYKEPSFIDLSRFAGDVYANSGGIRCINIFQIIDPPVFLQILNAIKTKLIQVLQELEKEYGDIDDLDIASGNKTEQEEKQIFVNIERLIYKDNSVSMGNENTISKSKIEAGENE